MAAASVPIPKFVSICSTLLVDNVETDWLEAGESELGCHGRRHIDDATARERLPIVVLLGGFGGYHGYSRYGGTGLGGVLGLVLIVLVVLWLLGGLGGVHV